MPESLKKACNALILGGLMALLFMMPGAAMQGVRDGLSLWADAVLPALLPFFVVTSLLQESGALASLSPLLRPLCRLYRLPDTLGGELLAGWLSGAPNGARLISPLVAEGKLSPAEAARFLSAATVTSPLFLIGTVGLYLGSPTLGALVYGVHLACAALNGVLWRGYGGKEALARASRPRAGLSPSLFLTLPAVLRSSCLSVLFIGGAIAVFSALTSVLTCMGVVDSLEKTLLFLLPPQAVAALVAGFFEVSNGCRLAALSSLSLPPRMAMLCAFAAFGGLSVLCQAQVFLNGTVKVAVYFAQRLTHAALSFAACRALFLLFGRSLPVFAVVAPVYFPADLHPYALPVLALCLAFSLAPWRRLFHRSA